MLTGSGWPLGMRTGVTRPALARSASALPIDCTADSTITLGSLRCPIPPAYGNVWYCARGRQLLVWVGDANPIPRRDAANGFPLRARCRAARRPQGICCQAAALPSSKPSLKISGGGRTVTAAGAEVTVPWALLTSR